MSELHSNIRREKKEKLLNMPYCFHDDFVIILSSENV